MRNGTSGKEEEGRSLGGRLVLKRGQFAALSGPRPEECQRPVPEPALCPVIKPRNWIPAVAALNSFPVKPESARVPRAQAGEEDHVTCEPGPHEGCSYCLLPVEWQTGAPRLHCRSDTAALLTP